MTTAFGYCQDIDNEDNLRLYTKSMKEATVYSLDEISKITFSKNGVQIWNTNWPTEYAYSNVRVLAISSHGSDLVGDANNDGKVTVADIVEIVKYINKIPSSYFNAVNADVNGDKTINASDIDEISKLIMKK
jgi:hypothetical protein